jgi:hypothetical protein
MSKTYGLKRGRGQPRQHGYDLQLALHVDLGTTLKGLSVNRFTDAYPLRLANGAVVGKATMRRRYYERRQLMAPIVWPDGRVEQSPIAVAYAAFLADVLRIVNAQPK